MGHNYSLLLQIIAITIICMNKIGVKINKTGAGNDPLLLDGSKDKKLTPRMA
jgi:hypothetical protein